MVQKEVRVSHPNAQSWNTGKNIWQDLENDNQTYRKEKMNTMKKEQILQQLFSQSNQEKALLLEKLVFCKLSDKYDFENYFRIGELRDSELLCLISFLYHQDCFLMMLDIMDRYRERFVFYDESLLKELDFSEELIARMERLNSLAEC